MTDFRKGDFVEILSQYRDPGDELLSWMALEDSEKGRVTIVAIDSPLSLKPSYTVNTTWLRRVSSDR